jgi:hypothetical protein
LRDRYHAVQLIINLVNVQDVIQLIYGLLGNFIGVYMIIGRNYNYVAFLWFLPMVWNGTLGTNDSLSKFFCWSYIYDFPNHNPDSVYTFPLGDYLRRST